MAMSMHLASRFLVYRIVLGTFHKGVFAESFANSCTVTNLLEVLDGW